MFKKILIANDGSAGAKHALEVAIDLAKRYNAELHSISIEEGVPHYAATIGEVEEFKKEGKFDLLVIGFMGHSKIFGRVWGSTSQNITKLSPCTVVVVK